MRKTLSTAKTEEEIITVLSEINQLHIKEQSNYFTQADLSRFSQIVGQQIFPSKWFEIMGY